MKHRLSLAGAIFLAALAVLLFFFGIQRYGSLDGLWRRASAEVTARLPHPVLVPTPLPIATILPTSTATASPPTAQPAIQPLPEPSATATHARQAATSTAAATSSTPRPAASQTATSAATRSPTPTRPPPTFTPTPPPTALPPAVRLSGLTHAWQTWNNCGPATLAMNLSYFGSRATQAEVAATLAAVQG